MAITRVQTKKNSGTSSLLVISGGVSFTSGNTLVCVVCIQGSSSPTVTTVTRDGGTQSFTKIGGIVRGTSRNTEIWYLPNVTGGTNINISCSGTTTDIIGIVAEYDGLISASNQQLISSVLDGTNPPILEASGNSKNNQILVGAISANTTRILETSPFVNPYNSYSIADQDAEIVGAANTFAVALLDKDIGNGSASDLSADCKYIPFSTNGSPGCIATFKRTTSTALVQTQGGSVASGTTLSLTLPSTPTLGNTLIIISSSASTPISSIATTGATWSSAVVSGTAPYTEIWYALNVPVNNDTVVTYVSSTGVKVGVLFEYSGLNTVGALDVTASAVANENPIDSGTTSTTSQANELWFAALAAGGSAENISEGSTANTNFNFFNITNGFTTPSVGSGYRHTSSSIGVRAYIKEVSATGTANTSGYLNVLPIGGELILAGIFDSSLTPNNTLMLMGAGI